MQGWECPVRAGKDWSAVGSSPQSLETGERCSCRISHLFYMVYFVGVRLESRYLQDQRVRLWNWALSIIKLIDRKCWVWDWQEEGSSLRKTLWWYNTLKCGFYMAGWLLACVQSNWHASSAREKPAARSSTPTSRTQFSKAIMCLHCLSLTNTLTEAVWSLQYLQYWTLSVFNKKP